jgi:hypothetical protein
MSSMVSWAWSRARGRSRDAVAPAASHSMELETPRAESLLTIESRLEIGLASLSPPERGVLRHDAETMLQVFDRHPVTTGGQRGAAYYDMGALAATMEPQWRGLRPVSAFRRPSSCPRHRRPAKAARIAWYGAQVNVVDGYCDEAVVAAQTYAATGRPGTGPCAGATGRRTLGVRRRLGALNHHDPRSTRPPARWGVASTASRRC